MPENGCTRGTTAIGGWLADLAPSQHGANLERDGVPPPRRMVGAPRRRLDFREIPFGGSEQVFALARPLGSEQGITAEDQPLVRVIRARDLGHLLLVEQRQLQGAAVGGERLDGGCAKHSDPVQPGLLEILFNPGAGDHAAITNENHALEAETFLQLVDLCRQRLRITRIPFEHRDGHRAAVGGAQQPEDDLRPAVAAVASPRQLATPTLQVARGDSAEHQRAVLQMTPRQRPLDRRLRRAESIKGTVELVLIHLGGR